MNTVHGLDSQRCKAKCTYDIGFVPQPTEAISKAYVAEMSYCSISVMIEVHEDFSLLSAQDMLLCVLYASRRVEYLFFN